MGLESVTHISDLVVTNPLGSDPKSQGDDHLRNIKVALKTDLPNITGPVTATQDELNVLDGLTGNGLIAKVGTGSAVRTITAGAGVLVTNGDGQSGNPTVAVNPGVGYGDVLGAASSTAYSIAVFADETGKVIAESGILAFGPALDNVASINSGQLAGHRNKLINGGMGVKQRLVSSATDDQYIIDRWYLLAESADPMTIAAVDDLDLTGYPGIKITNPNVTTARVGIAQIVETSNAKQLLGKASAVLSGLARFGFTGTVRCALLRTSATADVVNSDFVNNWASTTFTPGNFFSASVVVLATGSVSASAAIDGVYVGCIGPSAGSVVTAGTDNLIAFFWTDTKLAQTEFVTFGLAQLEGGDTRTAFEWRVNEDAMCLRYHFRIQANAANDILAPSGLVVSTTTARVITSFPSEMRIAPTALLQSGTAGDYRFISTGTTAVTCSSVPTYVIASRRNAMSLFTYVTGGLTVDRPTYGAASNSSAYLAWDAEL